MEPASSNQVERKDQVTKSEETVTGRDVIYRKPSPPEPPKTNCKRRGRPPGSGKLKGKSKNEAPQAGKKPRGRPPKKGRNQELQSAKPQMDDQYVKSDESEVVYDSDQSSNLEDCDHIMQLEEPFNVVPNGAEIPMGRPIIPVVWLLEFMAEDELSEIKSEVNLVQPQAAAQLPLSPNLSCVPVKTKCVGSEVAVSTGNNLEQSSNYEESDHMQLVDQAQAEADVSLFPFLCWVSMGKESVEPEVTVNNPQQSSNYEESDYMQLADQAQAEADVSLFPNLCSVSLEEESVEPEVTVATVNNEQSSNYEESDYMQLADQAEADVSLFPNLCSVSLEEESVEPEVTVATMNNEQSSNYEESDYMQLADQAQAEADVSLFPNLCSVSMEEESVEPEVAVSTGNNLEQSSNYEESDHMQLVDQAQAEADVSLFLNLCSVSMEKESVEPEVTVRKSKNVAPQAEKKPRGRPPKKRQKRKLQSAKPQMDDQSVLNVVPNGGERHTRAEIPMGRPIIPAIFLPELPKVDEPPKKKGEEDLVSSDYGMLHYQEWIKSASRQYPVFLKYKNILTLTANQLNFALCEVIRHYEKAQMQIEFPPGFYLRIFLGIQKYLTENDRIDVIFYDPEYAEFTDCLDRVLSKNVYSRECVYSDMPSEEHFWELKLFGGHSPYALLSALILYNTKYFHFETAEDHYALEFSSIIRYCDYNLINRPYRLILHDEKSPLHTGRLCDEPLEKRQLLPNFKKPARCPVKLFDLYTSKCPSRVLRGALFYLLPESKYSPESPIWFTMQHLPYKTLKKMLNIIKILLLNSKP